MSKGKADNLKKVTAVLFVGGVWQYVHRGTFQWHKFHSEPGYKFILRDHDNLHTEGRDWLEGPQTMIVALQFHEVSK